MLNPEARQLLVETGAKAEGVCMRLPRGLIEETLDVAPRSFKRWERSASGGNEQGERTVSQVCAAELDRTDPDCVHFGPVLTTSYFLDPETGERRRARRGEPKVAAVVCDALENFDYVMGLGLITDVERILAAVYEFAEMVAGTGKPIIAWAYSLDDLEEIY